MYAVLHVIEERGTEGNELEDGPASDEGHAQRQVVALGWW